MTKTDHDTEELEPSRSQRRREAWDVLELAEKLVALTNTQLREVPLDESVLEAIQLAQRITSHIAHKRQVHFLAKMLRKQDDLEPIRLAVDKPLEVRRRETAELHQMERWRERLIEEGDEALTELISAYPAVDRHHLRQLCRQALIERRENRAPSAQRAIFQVLKVLIRGPSPGPTTDVNAAAAEPETPAEDS
jgi:ribosome-associated protein